MVKKNVLKILNQLDSRSERPLDREAQSYLRNRKLKDKGNYKHTLDDRLVEIHKELKIIKWVLLIPYIIITYLAIKILILLAENYG